jgi:peptidoglycan hydrolase CwlO-like protein
LRRGRVKRAIKGGICIFLISASIGISHGISQEKIMGEIKLHPLREQVDTLLLRTQRNEKGIDDLRKKEKTLSSEIRRLDGRLERVEEALDELKGKVQRHTKKIGELSSEIRRLDGRLERVEEALDELKSWVSFIDSKEARWWKKKLDKLDEIEKKEEEIFKKFEVVEREIKGLKRKFEIVEVEREIRSLKRKFWFSMGIGIIAGIGAIVAITE